MNGGRVRHTCCKHCGADIEGYLYGYGDTLRVGREWRDRGNNRSCLLEQFDYKPQRHEPAITPEDRARPTTVRTRSKRAISKVTKRPYQASSYHSEARKALSMLDLALGHAKEAGAPYFTKRIQLAISSARGAVRNAGYRVTRERT